ncbi:MAG TPA: hypothetical protein VGC63_04080 [Solirubrobacterales bacterium]
MKRAKLIDAHVRWPYVHLGFDDPRLCALVEVLGEMARRAEFANDQMAVNHCIQRHSGEITRFNVCSQLLQ